MPVLALFDKCGVVAKVLQRLVFHDQQAAG